MATIVTNPNYIQVNGARIQKGTRDIIPLENGVRLQNTGSGSVIDILVEGTTIDGVAVADQTELLEYLDSQGFKSGGSSPETEVSWDDITDKPLKDLATPLADSEGLVPVYTQNGQLPVGTPEFPENAVPLILLDSRLSAAQRAAINALVSPETDYTDMTEATAAIKAIIDALKA